MDRRLNGTRAPGTALLRTCCADDAPTTSACTMAEELCWRTPWANWTAPRGIGAPSYDKPRSKVSELSCHAHSWVTATRDLLRLGEFRTRHFVLYLPTSAFLLLPPPTLCLVLRHYLSIVVRIVFASLCVLGRDCMRCEKSLDTTCAHARRI